MLRLSSKPSSAGFAQLAEDETCVSAGNGSDHRRSPETEPYGWHERPWPDTTSHVDTREAAWTFDRPAERLHRDPALPLLRRVPDDRDVEECEATSYKTASKRPVSRTARACRGYVTESPNARRPRDVTADRPGMTIEVLDKHYDHATKEEKGERRENGHTGV